MSKKNINKECCICNKPLDVKRDANGKIYWTQGNNSEPVARGRCCDACNWRVVIPARMGLSIEAMGDDE